MYYFEIEEIQTIHLTLSMNKFSGEFILPVEIYINKLRHTAHIKTLKIVLKSVKI